MKTFFYTIGGILILGGLLIGSKSPPDDLLVAAIAVFLILCGTVICCFNRG